MNPAPRHFLNDEGLVRRGILHLQSDVKNGSQPFQDKGHLSVFSEFEDAFLKCLAHRPDVADDVHPTDDFLNGDGGGHTGRLAPAGTADEACLHGAHHFFLPDDSGDRVAQVHHAGAAGHVNELVSVHVPEPAPLRPFGVDGADAESMEPRVAAEQLCLSRDALPGFLEQRLGLCNALVQGYVSFRLPYGAVWPLLYRPNSRYAQNNAVTFSRGQSA
jgi:hypothetical protein